ncbi:basic salivary proline-rich protein 2-like [Schistocerca serialis cubense]|uniref:basic salivary proline-rich protein 2-like n=1 Tax=Schistocerca serialis cubense TaxID=2023355 RepID=UPI00214EDB16|nr:basic salivary proline-rich protein 2-like [Schistocerca serialis cubense]
MREKSTGAKNYNSTEPPDKHVPQPEGCLSRKFRSDCTTTAEATVIQTEGRPPRHQPRGGRRATSRGAAAAPPAEGRPPRHQPRGGRRATSRGAAAAPPAEGRPPRHQPRGGRRATSRGAAAAPPAEGRPPRHQPRGGRRATSRGAAAAPPAEGRPPRHQPRGGRRATSRGAAAAPPAEILRSAALFKMGGLVSLLHRSSPVIRPTSQTGQSFRKRVTASGAAGPWYAVLSPRASSLLPAVPGRPRICRFRTARYGRRKPARLRRAYIYGAARCPLQELPPPHATPQT